MNMEYTPINWDDVEFEPRKLRTGLKLSPELCTPNLELDRAILKHEMALVRIEEEVRELKRRGEPYTEYESSVIKSYDEHIEYLQSFEDEDIEEEDPDF